ncbi:MAG TPA: tetratricopeptide repeat protein [Candidatus Sulfotelmatobacter sp.]|nr:tetratricopeptide repeat protein [Candidatus Sulfotelmatobacter sp.]
MTISAVLSRKAYAVTSLLSGNFVLLCLALIFSQLAFGQGKASLSGTVRDGRGNPIEGATVHLQAKDKAPGESPTAQTNSKGQYRFDGMHEGVYLLSTSMPGFEESPIPPVFLGPNESKTIDLTLGAPKNPAATQPQFFDQPQFTVAGVTDTTSLGGHGSDVAVRTRESIAKETVSLSKAAPSSRSADPALEQQLRAKAIRDPSSFDANHRLGQLLIQEGKASDAIPFLDRAAQLKPEDYDNSYDLALANANAGNYAQARDRAKILLATHDKAELHHLLGNVEEKLGDPLEAVRQYQRAAELDSSETYLYDWGSELLLHHAPEPAIEVFTKGNRLFPHSVRMLVGLGAALFAHGSDEEAIARLCEASDLTPDDPAPYLFLGKILRAEPRSSSKVVEKLRRFATLNPDIAEANYYYALALWKLPPMPPDRARLSQIESLLQKGLRLDSKLASASLQLGILYSEEGKHSDAISAYQGAIAANPQLGEAHYRLAQAYRQVGETDKAKEELRLYAECEKKSAETVERERHEIPQFVYTLRDQPPPEAH